MLISAFNGDLATEQQPNRLSYRQRTEVRFGIVKLQSQRFYDEKKGENHFALERFMKQFVKL